MPFTAFILTAALISTMPMATTAAHVRNWEAAAKATKTVYADVVRTRTDHLLKKSNESFGNVLLQRPNRGVLRLDARPPAGRKPDPNDYYSAIWTGKGSYYYDGPTKTMTEYGPADGKVQPKTPEEWLLRWFATLAEPPLAAQFLDGSIPAKDMGDRFVISLHTTDANYVYLELTPRLASDRTEYDCLIVVLHGPKAPAPATPYTLRTVVIRKRGGQEEEVWDFTSLKLDPPIAAGAFEYVPPPSDWKVQRTVRRNP